MSGLGWSRCWTEQSRSPSATTVRRGLDHHRVANALGVHERGLDVGNRVLAARADRDAYPRAINRRARIVSPMLAMASGDGPTYATPASTTAAASLGFRQKAVGIKRPRRPSAGQDDAALYAREPLRAG